MMSPAKRDRELVTDFAAESTVLREPQMMRVAWLTPADQTGLLGDIAHVIAIAHTARLGMHQRCLINRLRRESSFVAAAGLGTGRLGIWFSLGDFSFGAMNGKAHKLGSKRLLDMLGIGRIELVLFSHPPARPLSGLVLAANLVQFSKHHSALLGDFRQQKFCDFQRRFSPCFGICSGILDNAKQGVARLRIPVSDGRNHWGRRYRHPGIGWQLLILDQLKE